MVTAGRNRTFGDFIGASGITDGMLDTLISLKDFQGIKGLPPLSEIEDIRYEKNTRKSSRAEIERQKQEEVAKARVRTVDDKGRAYGTGRRKCSVARVWIQPGNGEFTINDKQFDAYFPMLDHRAALLRPFSETKTLGLWDIACTVQGGGTTGKPKFVATHFILIYMLTFFLDIDLFEIQFNCCFPPLSLNLQFYSFICQKTTKFVSLLTTYTAKLSWKTNFCPVPYVSKAFLPLLS